MNKGIKNYMLYSVLGTAFTLTACVDNDKNFPEVPDVPVKTVDLKVPADFEWSVTNRVSLQVNAPVTSVISVYTDAECTDASLVAVLHVKGGELTEMELDLPAACEKVYVKYPTGETTTAVITVNVLTAPASRAETTKKIMTIPSNSLHGMYEYEVGDTDEQGLNLVSTSGTVLFEDNWPDLGDYDFNDLVADYRITTHVSAGKEEQYKHERIEVSFTIRAIGGNLPSKLGLRFLGMENKELGLHSLRQSDIDRYEGVGETTKDGLIVTLANAGQPDETPIFWVEGLKQLKGESMFYNTERKDSEKLATVTFSIYASLKNNKESSSAFSQASYVGNQDIHLITSGGREIHLRGYEPTPLYTAYSKDVAASKDVAMSDKYKYATDKNLVWGMKVVSGFHFPLEKKDIREAYNPYFAQWVESDGKQADNWFKYWGDNRELVANW